MNQFKEAVGIKILIKLNGHENILKNNYDILFMHDIRYCQIAEHIR